MLRAVLVFSAFLVATPARAQVLFQDDFESGQLLVADGGKWSEHSGFAQMPWQLLTVSTTARWSGTRGLLLEDFGDGGQGVANGQFIRYFFPTPVFGDVYAAYRVRIFRDAGVGGPFPMQLHGNVGFGTIAELSLLGPTDEMIFNCGDTAFRTCQTDAGFAFEVWHNVLMALEGLGTNAGVCSLVVDGRTLCAQPMDWTNVGATEVLAGAGALNASWDGMLLMDDVVVTSGAPPPLQLSLVGPAIADAGECTTWDVGGLQMLDGGRVPLFNDTPLIIGSAAQTEVFRAPDCSTTPQGNPFNLIADGGTQLIGVRFLNFEGEAALIAADFSNRLSGAQQLITIRGRDAGVDAGADAGFDAGLDAGAADAGTDAGGLDSGNSDGGAQSSDDYRVGCGCGSTPASALAVAFLAILLVRVARSRKSR